MEPVPETKQLEEFQSSPLPSLRLRPSNSSTSLATAESADLPRKPPNLRRSTTEPYASWSSPSSPSWQPPYRPRASSPLSSLYGAHARSRSTNFLAPPSMDRTQSLPGLNGSGHLLVSSPFQQNSRPQSPARIRAPRKPVDEVFPSWHTPRASVLHDVSVPEADEEQEQQQQQQQPAERSSSPSLVQLGLPPAVVAASRLRRPSSPLRHVSSSSTNSLPGVPSTPSSIASSPSYRSSYDSLSSSYALGSAYPSSVPSTPTSMRSRSPSISSLETIPDSPDAEEAALEADRIAQLKAAADAAEDGENGENGDAKGRSSLDGPSRGRTLGFGARDKRKRWSVCGAERRQDLDLETIWED